MKQILVITLSSDWKEGFIKAGNKAKKGIEKGTYQGESLNFESPGIFFSKLTKNRWDIVRVLQAQGQAGVRELARRVGRDVRRVHDDISILLELGLIDKRNGKLICPYTDIHVDMHMKAA